MRALFFTFILTLLFCSCATILQQPITYIRVNSKIDSLMVNVEKDVLNWQKLPVTIVTERSKEDLLLTTLRGGKQDTLTINSRLSNVFWWTNILTYGFGYLIDLNTPKRFTYPAYITIDPANPKGYYTRNESRWGKISPGKNLVLLKISVPEGNHFYLNQGVEYGHSFGFLGISGGIEYYFSDRFCLNADIGTLTDFMLPFPAPVDFYGSYSRSFARYIDLQVGSDFKRIHFDIGLQYNRTSYYERETVELYPVYIDTLKYYKKQENLGFALSANYKITPVFSIGVNYYPSVLAWDDSKMYRHYSHLLFFELTFRIKGYSPGR